LTLTAKKPSKIPQNPKKLGDHIKRRRLVLGLVQRDVAKLLGVDTSTITNWEKSHTDPQLYLIPKVIEFLGYCPDIVEAMTPGEKIRECRKTRGMSQKLMAKLLNIDPATLARWERDKGKAPLDILALVKDGKE
jgi:transcriptional regulator with XRE-family HTH domain